MMLANRSHNTYTNRWASCKNVDTQAKSAITHIAFLPAPGLNNIVSNSPDTPKEKSGHFGILQEYSWSSR